MGRGDIKQVVFKPTGVIPRTTWGKPQYVAVKDDRQRIETSRGCPNDCPFCYEPTELEVFPIPKIERNYVEILDMNFLYQPNILERIRELGKIKVNGKVVRYEEICGFDYRLLTQEIADELKRARFIKPRIAWDYSIKEQYKIKDAITQLTKTGYKTKDIMVFVIVNWEIPKTECDLKLDLMKIWNVKVGDCCYDGGYRHATPERWTAEELREFRAKCRKHNQLVNFGIDPEVSAGIQKHDKLYLHRIPCQETQLLPSDPKVDIQSIKKASGRVKFDFWPCMRQMTRRWGCNQILHRLIENVDKPDICFGKTDGIPSDIITVDKNPTMNPTHCLDWRDLGIFRDNQFEFGFWDPPYDKLYMPEYREIWRVCKRLAILHQLIYLAPKDGKRTHMIGVTTGPRMRIRCLQVFKKQGASA